MREVRLFFTKLGNAKYISHLDMNRVFLRAVRRAEIPVWFTEGFNPHPYITFSLPLPLGVESVCECADIRIEDDNYSDRKISEELNRVLPPDIRVVSAGKPQMKPAEIYCGIYDIEYCADNTEKIASDFEKIMRSDCLSAVKKAKQGRRKVEVTVNLLEYIITYAVEQNGDKICLKILALSGQNKNLNPMLFVSALEKACGFEYESRSIVKCELFNENFEEFR